MTFQAVGSFVQSNSGSFTITPTTTGNFFLLTAQETHDTAYAASVSGGNCTWTTLVPAHFSAVSTTNTQAVFLGRATAAGSASVTVTYVGTTTDVNIMAHEFSSSTGICRLDTYAILDSTGVTTWPAPTPSAAGELYWALVYDLNTAIAGTTQGYTYFVNANTNGTAYNTSYSSLSAAPVWGDSSQQYGIITVLTSSPGTLYSHSSPPPRPVVSVSNAGWRGAGHSR